MGGNRDGKREERTPTALNGVTSEGVECNEKVKGPLQSSGLEVSKVRETR